MPASTPQTVTDVANLALQALGESKTLLDVDSDRSSVGVAVKLAFWQAWDETLRAYPWDCAKKRARLPAMSVAPAFGYTVQYQLPADYLAIQELPDLTPGEPYSVERWSAPADPPGTEVLVIACDMPAPLDLVYTYQMRNIAHADPNFIGAFKYLLAFEIAPAVTKDTKKRNDMFAVWQDKTSVAMRTDARQGPRRQPPDSDAVRIRD